MYGMLRDHYGFEPANMRCLIDEDPNAAADKLPTGANIKKNLTELVAASKPGDVLFFHFSGHGTQVRAVSLHKCDPANTSLLQALCSLALVSPTQRRRSSRIHQ